MEEQSPTINKEFINKLAEKEGITLKRMAEDLHISKGTLYTIRTSKKLNYTYRHVILLSKKYNVPIDDFFIRK